ncbi:MAG: hypothetical protein HXY34_13765 [Candidatus Thorarchaeota archaeon]|nr:hypothetical protein [Candidatus Thorarchaeota archaeon]
MTLQLEPEMRDVIAVHAFFAAIAASVLLVPVGAAVGWKMLALVCIYNALIPIVGLIRGHYEWINIWSFVFLLSVLQVFPDWVLSEQLGVLVFPVDGSPMIGPVPLYMAGLWTIPLFAIIYSGARVEEKYGYLRAQAFVVSISVLIFGIAEETMWMLPSWAAQNVSMIGHVAVYIIIPELVLGSAAFFIYSIIRFGGHWRKVFWAFHIMVLYLGEAVFFYFVIERILLG